MPSRRGGLVGAAASKTACGAGYSTFGSPAYTGRVPCRAPAGWRASPPSWSASAFSIRAGGACLLLMRAGIGRPPPSRSTDEEDRRPVRAPARHRLRRAAAAHRRRDPRRHAAQRGRQRQRAPIPARRRRAPCLVSARLAEGSSVAAGNVVKAPTAVISYVFATTINAGVFWALAPVAWFVDVVPPTRCDHDSCTWGPGSRPSRAQRLEAGGDPRRRRLRLGALGQAQVERRRPLHAGPLRPRLPGCAPRPWPRLVPRRLRRRLGRRSTTPPARRSRTSARWPSTTTPGAA